MADHILIVVSGHQTLGDSGEPTGWFCSEVSHPLEVFREAGFNVTFCSPQGGATQPDPGSLDRSDPLNSKLLDNKADMESLATTFKPEELDGTAYKAIFFAGGHGTMWDFPDHAGLRKLIQSCYDSGNVVSAVCHGPAALVNAKLGDGSYLVAGKDVTCFTDSEEAAVEKDDIVPFLLESRMRERGATVHTAPDFGVCVQVSERLVTGQNPASAQATAQAVVDLVFNSDKRVVAHA
ncbi:type 1 glutamine amidotransferase domain-containing protein [Allohahella marinimesophila]|uniref:Type 1 glutamine amidotransferase domain-containing protein n=1 Tax=Allohahella marinimesophila TaxID=1054972 RepID=A0ABP7PQR8_9GAMM